MFIFYFSYFKSETNKKTNIYKYLIHWASKEGEKRLKVLHLIRRHITSYLDNTTNSLSLLFHFLCSYDRGGESEFKVVVGDHDLDITELSERTVDIAEIIMHPDYSHITHNNDVALFRLAEELTFSQEVRPVCLPRSDVSEMMMCMVTGWGRTQGDLIQTHTNL